MVYNGYYKVMSNIPKMGQLPTPGFDQQKSGSAKPCLGANGWLGLKLQTNVDYSIKNCDFGPAKNGF